VELQGDNLDSDQILPEVKTLATQYGTEVGWQSNKHGGTGAGCAGEGAGSCDPDGPSGPFVQLLENGEQNRGAYVEVWSNDVVSYPQSFAAAHALGLYATTAVEPAAGRPRFLLFSPVPNPARGSVDVSFRLGEATSVQAFVFDVSGRIVRDLARTPMAAGDHTLTWDGRDEWGRSQPSSVYFVRLRAGGLEATRTVVRCR
jgi:hypothetical protein